MVTHDILERRLQKNVAWKQSHLQDYSTKVWLERNKRHEYDFYNFFSQKVSTAMHSRVVHVLIVQEDVALHCSIVVPHTTKYYRDRELVAGLFL